MSAIRAETALKKVNELVQHCVDNIKEINTALLEPQNDAKDVLIAFSKQIILLTEAIANIGIVIAWHGHELKVIKKNLPGG